MSLNSTLDIFIPVIKKVPSYNVLFALFCRPQLHYKLNSHFYNVSLNKLLYLLYNIYSCRPVHFFYVLHIDNHKKLEHLSSSIPQKDFDYHLESLVLNTINESLSFLINLLSSLFNFVKFDSEISPSKTEFCICIKYFLHAL